MEQLNLSKRFFSDNQYKKVINTSFTQLVPQTADQQEFASVSVEQFFQYYQELFYLIPKFGEMMSHEYLIKASSEYVGTSETQNEEIQALINEITSLRQTNLELNQQLINTKISNG